jgi:hypothetical protein
MLDRRQAGYGAEIDKNLRCRQTLLHRRQERLSARKQLRIILRAQEPERLVEAGRATKDKIVHGAIPISS